MHDGMAIGFYLVRGSNNLVLNCDAYNNYDPVSENGTGGNVDASVGIRLLPPIREMCLKDVGPGTTVMTVLI